MTEDKNFDWGKASVGAGVAMLGLGAVFFGLGRGAMDPGEKEAFEKLDLSCMTPKQVWLAGSKYGQVPVLEVRRGLRACGRMLLDEDPPPQEVAAAVVAHWLAKACSLVGVPVPKPEIYEVLINGELEDLRDYCKAQTP